MYLLYNVWSFPPFTPALAKQLSHRAFCRPQEPPAVHYSVDICTIDVNCIGIRERRRRRRQPERQKRIKLRLAKQLCTCITLFCTFLCRHFTTTTWKCLISRFVENVNARQQLSFSFSELRYRSLLEFNPRKNCQHLMNLTRWNKRDKVWSSGAT